MNDTAQAPAANRLQHHGTGSELFVIFLINVVLKFVTLGIYHFWGKTRIRRYLWSQTSFDGERLEYTGTGGELFLGFLKVMGLYLLFVIGFMLVSAVSQTAAMAVLGGLYVAMPVLIGAGLYGAQRYQLTRTRLRGIRFSLVGSAWEYGWAFLGHGILLLLTLGLYKPFMDMALARRMYGETRYGSQAFSFEGKGGDLFKPYLVCWLLTIPTVGLVWFWYLGVALRYQTQKLSFPGINFRLDASAWNIFGLWITNILLLIITLGLAYPWVVVRSLRFVTERLAIAGEVDYAAVAQAADGADATGEGLVEALDLGAI